MRQKVFNMYLAFFVGKWLVAVKSILQINVIKNGILFTKNNP